MPSRDPWPHTSSLLAMAAVVAALAGAAAALWWPIGRSGTATDVYEAATADNVDTGDGNGSAGLDTGAQTTAVPLGSTTAVSTTTGPARPAQRQAPVLSLAELLELKANLGTTPDPGGEFTHTGELMLFADAVQRFRQLQSSRSDDAELQGVARLVDEMLGPLAQRRDLPPAEARALKADVLLVLQPDLTTRQNLLVRWDVEQARALAATAR